MGKATITWKVNNPFLNQTWVKVDFSVAIKKVAKMTKNQNRAHQIWGTHVNQC